MATSVTGSKEHPLWVAREMVRSTTGINAIAKPGDVQHFAHLTLDGAKELIGRKLMDPQERQNYAPPIGDMLEGLGSLKNAKDRVSLIGYVVWPPREDARISLEGYNIDHPTAEDLMVLAAFGEPDETNLRHWWD
ncbi:MAG: hypothetical protein IT443_12010 [Phycisphaeraceae bacterium]|nr:hypothetical protein [Phycisphaeraceae bacterium]